MALDEAVTRKNRKVPEIHDRFTTSRRKGQQGVQAHESAWSTPHSQGGPGGNGEGDADLGNHHEQQPGA